MEKRCRCYCWPARGSRCQEHAGPAAGRQLRPGWEGPLSKQDSRPVESITQLISRKAANGKRNFPSHSKKSKKICGHFREPLMETDGDVGQEVERPQLGERPPCEGHHRGLQGQSALENQPRSLLWGTQHLLIHSVFPLF